MNAPDQARMPVQRAVPAALDGPRPPDARDALARQRPTDSYEPADERRRLAPFRLYDASGRYVRLLIDGRAVKPALRVRRDVPRAKRVVPIRQGIVVGGPVELAPDVTDAAAHA